MPEKENEYSTASIAKCYVDVLKEQLPAGSQVLTAGYSFGGILAFETARYLSEAGFEISKVINIDQPAPEAITKANLVRRLTNWLHRLKTPSLAWEELNYSKQKGVIQSEQPTGIRGIHEMRRSFDLEDILYKIENAYQPRPCDLELELIRSDVIEAKYTTENDYGWTKYTRSLSVHRISGTHFTIFRGRNVGRLAAKFQQLIRN